MKAKTAGSWQGSAAGWSELEPSDEDVPGPPLARDQRYEARGLIGRGGMGRVRISRDHWLNRDVAIKEPASYSPEIQRRLVREATITARLEHPGIIPVHDVGQDEQGRVFYTMRLLRGRSLARALREASSLSERLALLRHLRDACETMAYAHSRGVLHRDLKPDNIMIGEFGESQIVDWGLALRLDEAEALGDAAAVGTPGYMSPEQGRGLPLGPRSDVWSLGATLRALLVGKLALEDAALPEDAPPELVAICARAMAEDPQARHASAKSLADELTHFLEGRPVDSYRYSPVQLLRRLVSQWRAPLTVASVALLALAFVVTTAWRRNVAERERAVDASEAALAAEREAVASREAATDVLVFALVEQARSAHAEGARAEAEVLAAHALARRPTPAGLGILRAWSRGSWPTLSASWRPEFCTSGRSSADGRLLLCVDQVEVSLWSLEHQSRLWRREIGAKEATFVDGARLVALFNPDSHQIEAWDWAKDRLHASHDAGVTWRVTSDRMLSVIRGELVELHDLQSDRLRTIEACPRRALLAEVSPDRARLAVACLKPSVRIFELETGALLSQMDLDEGLSPSDLDWIDERELLVADWHGGLRRVDPEADEVVWSAHISTPISRVELRGQLASVSAWGRGVALIELEQGRELARTPRRDAKLVGLVDGAAHPELLTLGSDGILRRWQLPAGSLRPPVFDHGHGLSSAELSPDGELVALAGGDGVASVWSTRSGRRLASISWSRDVLKDARFSPDGGLLAASGVGRPGVAVASVEDWRVRGPFGALPCRRVAWLGPHRIACLSYGLELELIDLSTTPPQIEQRELEVICKDLEIVEGDALLWCDDSRTRWLESGDVGPVLPPDTVLVAHSDSQRARATPRRIALEGLGDQPGSGLELDHAAVTALDFSPDGRTLASGDIEGGIRVWDASTGTLVALLPGHDSRVSRLRVDEGGELLISASWDGDARAWDLRSPHRDPELRRAEIEGAWGLTLDDVLRSPSEGEPPGSLISND